LAQRLGQACAFRAPDRPARRPSLGRPLPAAARPPGPRRRRCPPAAAPWRRRPSLAGRLPPGSRHSPPRLPVPVRCVWRHRQHCDGACMEKVSGFGQKVAENSKRTRSTADEWSPSSSPSSSSSSSLATKKFTGWPDSWANSRPLNLVEVLGFQSARWAKPRNVGRPCGTHLADSRGCHGTPCCRSCWCCRCAAPSPRR
jgi:hypothetical protein